MFNLRSLSLHDALEHGTYPELLYAIARQTATTFLVWFVLYSVYYHWRRHY